MNKANVDRDSKRDNRTRANEIMSILSKHDIVHGMTPAKLVALFFDLGPTFVKIGQLLSMRTDLLPAEYCEELARLRTNINPMSFEEIKIIVEKEYAKDIDDVFTHFDRSPIGAASIAQVHYAKIGDEEVVVKIQRPSIYETMSSDIRLIKKAVGIIKHTNLVGEEVDLNKILDEMWKVTKKEIDFHYEASYLKQFQQNNSEIKYVRCPRVYEELSTQTILVMEYIDGIYIDDLESLQKSGYDTGEIAEKIANNYVKQVIDDGFFHADPHVGNIKIDAGKIVWLDLGMMGVLEKNEKMLLGEIVKSFDDGNTNRLADAVLNLGTPLGDVDMEVLNRELESLISKYAMGDVGNIDIIALTNDFRNLVRRNRLAFPESLAMLGRGIATIQSVLRTLDQKISFAEIMTNYVSNDFMSSLNMDKELKQIVKAVYYSMKKSLTLPSQISDTLKMLEKGLTKIKLELGFSGKMKTDLDSMINKMVMSILAAALLIGSSLICTTDMTPKMLNIPIVGFVGFLAAIILMIKLLFFDKSNKK